MVDVTTRAGKGSPLTNAEIDANFSGLDSGKQPTLVSGVNIKTLNGVPILGAGDIALPLPTVSDIAPASPSVGDLWVDSSPDGYDSGWITGPSLLNSWVVSGATPAYRRIGNRVTLRGMADNVLANNSTIGFVLPVGFRPTTQSAFKICSGLLLISQGTATIHTNGDVHLYDSAAASTLVVCLDGVSFLID